MTDFKVPARPEGAKRTSDAERGRHRAEPAKGTSTLSRPSARTNGKRAAVVATAFAVLLGAGAAGQASGTAAHTAEASKDTAASLQTLDFERVGSNAPTSPAPMSVEAQASKIKPAKAPAAPAPKPTKAPAPAKAKPAAIDDPAGAQAYAASQLPAHGWAPSEMQCLMKLWTRESDWKTTATNASSGAYGVVQSLPAEKMASAGADYRTNYRTQINWGLQYVQDRYGSPCGALNFHYANNWY
ncbi:hypothetical protein [Arthrobacter sp. C9C5]|uniref:aggregation-promoting factor C-terminal-like domain-containing protein n=1 Tax=Arthrobacter sp. C9C5 TaxID=2735267 RepID=UPI001584E650|nr:hypothetical protein [Arthrobacter sp. C9C5]NUU33049.1 hypothetical protein [Arthrobacter sp. C9C5]